MAFAALEGEGLGQIEVAPIHVHGDKVTLCHLLRHDGKRVRDAAFFLIIMLVTFAATLLNPQKYVSSTTIQKCVEHVSTST